MIIDVLRYSSKEEDTLSIINIDGKFFCYGLEDEYRLIKVKGETRIPEGSYEIGWQQVVTPMTKKYRKRYNWFKNHIHVKNVPNFTSVYIHIGNTEEDTAGCLLVGDKINNNNLEYGFIGSSTNAYQRLYKKITRASSSGEKITINYKTL